MSVDAMLLATPSAMPRASHRYPWTASLFHLPQRCAKAAPLNAACSADAPPILRLCEPWSF
eukprot:1834765-Pyramimonas_sp.AAC.1